MMKQLCLSILIIRQTFKTWFDSIIVIYRVIDIFRETHLILIYHVCEFVIFSCSADQYSSNKNHKLYLNLIKLHVTLFTKSSPTICLQEVNI